MVGGGVPDASSAGVLGRPQRVPRVGQTLAQRPHLGQATRRR
jgi:hypothetical protein